MDRPGPDRGAADRASGPAADRTATGRGSAEHTSADQDGHGPAGSGYTASGHSPDDGVAEGRTTTDRGAPNGSANHVPAADRVPAPAAPADDGMGGSTSREGLAVPAARDRAVG